MLSNRLTGYTNRRTLYPMSEMVDSGEGMPLTAAEVLSALAAHECRAAVLALAVRRLETCGVWAADGSVSIAAWLRQHARMSNSDAQSWVHRGRFLDRFPAIADAAVEHTLSAGQVEALRKVCTRKVEPVMGDHQQVLVDAVKDLSVKDTEITARRWKQHVDAIIDDPEPAPEPERSLTVAAGADGSLTGNFTLGAAAGSELAKAIQTASTWEGKHDTRTPGERRADALGDIAAFYNLNHDRPGTPRHRPHFDLTIDADTLDHPEAFDDNGDLVDPAVAATRLCDCVLHRVTRDTNGVPTSYGRGTYTVPPDLFRIIAARDGGCRHPGCDRPVRYCDAHHITYWRHMGTTDLENLVLLCNRHPHQVHRQPLHLKLLPNAQLHITWPNGQHHESQPRGKPPRAGPRSS